MELGFGEGEGGVDNKVEGNKSERGIGFSPLEIMFSSNLNRSGKGKVMRNDRPVNGVMAKLSFSPIDLKGS